VGKIYLWHLIPWMLLLVQGVFMNRQNRDLPQKFVTFAADAIFFFPQVEVAIK
jgi:hypothetical protein